MHELLCIHVLIVDRHGKAHWSQSPSSVTTCMSIDKSKLVELTEYLIDNVYVKAGIECIVKPLASLWERTVHPIGKLVPFPP